MSALARRAHSVGHGMQWPYIRIVGDELARKHGKAGRLVLANILPKTPAIQHSRSLLPERHLLDDGSTTAETTEAYQTLAPQSIAFEQRTGYVGALVLLGITVVISTPMAVAFAWRNWWIWGALLVVWLLLGSLFLWHAHVWPRIVYRATRWRLDETGMEILRGVWWKHRIAIPVARVQHVDVSQGPIQRMFDLATLTIHTAGTKNASIELSGLEHAQALLLRDRLIEQKDSLDVT